MDSKVIDKDRQWSLPCPWDAGHCHAEGLTYLWNVTDPDYCPVTVVKEFLGHRLRSNVSNPGDFLDSHQAEATISADLEEKIRIRPAGPLSQCGRVVTSTNIEDMFLFPILQTDECWPIIEDRCSPGRSTLVRSILGNTSPTVTNTCTTISLRKRNGSSTLSSIRTAYNGKMRLERLASLSMDFQDTSLSSYRMGPSLRHPARLTTGTSVCPE